MHRSADFLPLNRWPEGLLEVRSVIPHAAGTDLDWTSQVLVPITAEWAVKTAQDFLKVFDDFVPDPARMPRSYSGGA